MESEVTLCFVKSCEMLTVALLESHPKSTFILIGDRENNIVALFNIDEESQGMIDKMIKVQGSERRLNVVGLAKYDGEHLIDTSIFENKNLLYIAVEESKLSCISLSQKNNMQSKSILKTELINNKDSPLVSNCFYLQMDMTENSLKELTLNYIIQMTLKNEIMIQSNYLDSSEIDQEFKEMLNDFEYEDSIKTMKVKYYCKPFVEDTRPFTCSLIHNHKEKPSVRYTHTELVDVETTKRIGFQTFIESFLGKNKMFIAIVRARTGLKNLMTRFPDEYIYSTTNHTEKSLITHQRVFHSLSPLSEKSIEYINESKFYDKIVLNSYTS